MKCQLLSTLMWNEWMRSGVSKINHKIVLYRLEQSTKSLHVRVGMLLTLLWRANLPVSNKCYLV